MMNVQTENEKLKQKIVRMVLMAQLTIREQSRFLFFNILKYLCRSRPGSFSTGRKTESPPLITIYNLST